MPLRGKQPDIFLPGRTLPRPIRFVLVGLSNTIVDIAMFTALVAGFAVSPVSANIVGYITGTINSFVLNRNWTFRDTYETPCRGQFARFTGVNLAALGLSTIIVWTLAPLLGAIPAKLLSVLVTFFFSYTLSKAIVFRRA
jgi:putative flippase GtrA